LLVDVVPKAPSADLTAAYSIVFHLLVRWLWAFSYMGRQKSSLEMSMD